MININKFLEFRDLESLAKKENEYIKKLEEKFENMSKENNHSLEDIIKIVKNTGILIHPYPGESNYEKLIKKIDNFFYEKKNEKLTSFWNNYKFEASIINNLFQEIYESVEYKTTLEIPSKIEVQTYLACLEIILSQINNINCYPISIEFEHASKSFDSDEARNRDMFDYISIISGKILNYLLWYKQNNISINTNIKLEKKYLLLASNHFSSYDKINLLNDVSDYWKYYDYKIKQKYEDSEISFTPRKAEYLKNTISTSRFESRRHLINIQVEHLKIDKKIINRHNPKLPHKEFINRDEFISYHTFVEYFYINNIEMKILNVPANQWIRSLSILKKKANEFLETRKIKEDSHLYDICLYFDRKNLVADFLKYGIENENIDTIFKNLIFNSRNNDLFDAPLIQIDQNSFLIVPSILANIDTTRVLMCMFLEKKTDMNFKGIGFENKIIKELKSQNIIASSLNSKRKNKSGEDRIYQCDVAFLIDNDLFICECKAYSQPVTHRNYYELIDKKEDTITVQLKQIFDYYKNNLDIVKSQLKLPTDYKFNKIHSLLITTVPLGKSEKINSTFIIDHSAFSNFIRREDPTIPILSQNKGCKLDLFSLYKGEITKEKFLKFLKSPLPIELEKKRRREISKSIPLEKSNLSIFDYAIKQ